MASAGNSSSRAESPVMTISSRAGSHRSSGAGPPSTSHLESTITRLLVATKQLLEGLARWSRREVDENAISEIYVKLGNDFNVACAAFAREGITMNELLSVPADLRVCLETCLSDQPSQATLERHLPQVRQIIIGLLHGLREKQRLYREGVAARRQRDARAAAAAAGNVTQQQQQSTASSNLTPTSANRSRDELRRFVTQTQQQQVSGPTASTSSSSMGANEPAGRPSRGGESNESFGAPSTRRSASDQGLPYTSSSSMPNGVPPSGEARFSTVMSSRSTSGTTAASSGGGGTTTTTTFPPRSGSIGESTRSSSSQNRIVFDDEDAFGPVRSPSSSSNSTNRLTRSMSSASLETTSVPAPVQQQHQSGNAARPALERSSTGRIMMSPPPPPRRSKRDEEVPAVPPRTPTTEDFDPMTMAGTTTTTTTAAADSAARRPFSRNPSAGSIRSLMSADGENAPVPAQVQVQAASLEALRADNLSRRASKRYSAYAIQKMTSPNTTTSSSGGGGAGGGGLSPSPSSSSNGFGGGGVVSGSGGEERNARAGKAGASSSAGRELAGVDTPRKNRNENYHHHNLSSATASGPSSRPSGHRSTSSPSVSRRDAVPPLPPIPRSYTAAAAAAVGGTTPASPIAEEEHERSVDSFTSPSPFSSSSSPGPPTFPLPSVPSASGGGRANHLPPTPQQPQRSNSSSSLSRETPRAGSPSVVTVQHLPQLAPSGLAGSGSVASFSASDEPEYPCSIFLQIGRNVKKARLSSPPEVASLRQLFVERFGYNPGSGEWPDIYLRDADSGVHYELEEMSEIRAGSVLSLNVDTVEQVKTHIDHGLSSLAQEIKELRATVSAIRVPTTTSANALLSPSQRDSVMSAAGMSPSLRPSPSERDFEHAAKRVLRSQTPSRVTSILDPDPKPIADEAAAAEAVSAPASSSEEAAATPAVPESAPSTSVTPVVDMLKSQHADVQTLRREIGVLRQVYADWTTQTKEIFASVRVQTSHVQHLAKTKLSTDRTFVEAGTARLDSESTDLVVKVDELQDSIEQLRADTVRGVKPRPQTLSETASALRKAVETRQKLSEWLKEVKPTWSQMWSNELGKILGEQKAVEQQETLLGELDEDLEDVAKVFKNIQAVAKQLKTTGLGVKPRERDFGGGNIENAQEGLSTVLLEVKALSPDPTKRLEAIERAEKQRQAELASRTDEFTEELGDFVGKGRLKKSGGIEETERIRQARSEATLRSMFQS